MPNIRIDFDMQPLLSDKFGYVYIYEIKMWN